jgi:AraC-like DNA-binding protein
VDAYCAGATVRDLSQRYSIHRTTVLDHLGRRGVSLRRSVRKLTDQEIGRAAIEYRSGLSLKTVAADVGVDPSTLTREFRRAGVPIRPRRGWPPA